MNKWVSELSKRKNRKRLSGAITDRRISGITSLVVLAAVGLIASLFGDGASNVVKVGLLVVGLGCAGYAFYFDFHRPTVSSEEQARSDILDNFILPLLADEVHSSLALHEEIESVRAYVLIMRYRFTWPRMMMVKYKFGAFSDGELKAAWDSGVCWYGKAFERKQQFVFVRNGSQTPDYDMVEEQINVVNGIGTCVVTPIFRNSRRDRAPVGVLCVDTPAIAPEEFIRETEALTQCEKIASTIGTFVC